MKTSKGEKGTAIRLYWKDRTPDEILGPGSYKDKSHTVEGPHVQFSDYIIFKFHLLYFINLFWE